MFGESISGFLYKCNAEYLCYVMLFLLSFTHCNKKNDEKQCNKKKNNEQISPAYFIIKKNCFGCSFLFCIKAIPKEKHSRIKKIKMILKNIQFP